MICLQKKSSNTRIPKDLTNLIEGNCSSIVGRMRTTEFTGLETARLLPDVTIP